MSESTIPVPPLTAGRSAYGPHGELAKSGTVKGTMGPEFQQTLRHLPQRQSMEQILDDAARTAPRETTEEGSGGDGGEKDGERMVALLREVAAKTRGSWTLFAPSLKQRPSVVTGTAVVSGGDARYRIYTSGQNGHGTTNPGDKVSTVDDRVDIHSGL